VDWLTILNVLFSIMGVAIAGFLAYVGGLHLRRVARDRTRTLSRKSQADKVRAKRTRARSDWRRAASAS